MTSSISCALAVTFMLAATSMVASAQDTTHAQHKQDSTKKGMMHDMSKMQGHDMSKMEKMGGASKEMNAFHQLLAATYHPASKDSLQPLREKAADLAAAAKAWATAGAPAMCRSEATTKTLATLNTDAQAIAERVAANATDTDLKQRITALHTLFETVEMKCGGHEMKGMKH